MHLATLPLHEHLTRLDRRGRLHGDTSRGNERGSRIEQAGIGRHQLAAFKLLDPAQRDTGSTAPVISLAVPDVILASRHCPVSA